MKRYLAILLVVAALIVAVTAVASPALAKTKLKHALVLSHQGSSATDWSAPGTTTFAEAPAAVLVGSAPLELQSGEEVASAEVLFDPPFAGPPVVITQVELTFPDSYGDSRLRLNNAQVRYVTSEGFTVSLLRESAQDTYPLAVHWVAYGPR